MYEAREQDDILSELQTNAGSNVSSYEGTFAYDVLAANSIEFSKQEVEREEAYKAAFAKTSWGEYLEMRAEEHGIFRKVAVSATGTITITGTGTVSNGAVFQTSSGIQFHTLKEIDVSGSGSVAIACDTAGTAGNVDADTITVISASIPGITAVTNPAATTGGYNEETDTELYNRLIFKVRQPATSGNVNDYTEWATSVDGVGKVKVIPLWNGNGTVKVLVTDSNGSPASDTLLTAVRTLIETKHPIGATVTIAAPTTLALTIALTVTDGTGDADAIKKLLNAYFVSDTFSETKVSYALVGKMILDDTSTGVNDYDSLTINGATANISITDEEIPTVTVVTLT